MRLHIAYLCICMIFHAYFDTYVYKYMIMYVIFSIYLYIVNVHTYGQYIAQCILHINIRQGRGDELAWSQKLNTVSCHELVVNSSQLHPPPKNEDFGPAKLPTSSVHQFSGVKVGWKIPQVGLFFTVLYVGFFMFFLRSASWIIFVISHYSYPLSCFGSH